MEIIILALAWLLALGILIWCLWVGIPALTGLPYVPTRPERIRRALEMARLCPGETLVDLGAGDGRVLVIGARDFGARAAGYEIGFLQYLAAAWKIRSSRLQGQVRLFRKSLFQADLSKADVVFAYMTSRQAAFIRPVLESQLKPGTRVAAISFMVEGWQPDELDEKNLITIYHMPPTPGSLFTYLVKQKP